MLENDKFNCKFTLIIRDLYFFYRINNIFKSMHSVKIKNYNLSLRRRVQLICEIGKYFFLVAIPQFLINAINMGVTFCPPSIPSLTTGATLSTKFSTS